jgi:diguanylate cyclase (GGDEF)-like protein
MSSAADGNHFSCSMTAVLIGVVDTHGGEDAIRETLLAASSNRSPDYLLDTGNWVSHDEAVALWRAGAEVTHHPQFARMVGEQAGRRLNGSPVAALLRSLGSPENVYAQLATTSTRFSTVSSLEAKTVGPGFAEIVSTPLHGHPRSAEHCAWTSGLLTQPPALFGMAPAVIEHDECAAFGAPACLYRARWAIGDAAVSEATAGDLLGLRARLEGMEERLRSMFATAADLIAADGIEAVLARVTERAAVEVRAPRHLLAVRTSPGGQLYCHQKGFDSDEVEEFAERILDPRSGSTPDSWLVVPVRSNRRDYGRLLAMHDSGQRFYPQERELLEAYARCAASALDGATALAEAKQLYEQSTALLELSRALATAGTSGEVASKLADAVPVVVDCDRVAVYLWDVGRGELVRHATSTRDGARATELAEDLSQAPTPDGPLARLLSDRSGDPLFVDGDHGDRLLHAHFARLGAVATIIVPLVTPDSFLGLLAVSVHDRPGRLEPAGGLLDRLSGVAAQATTALQNGRLVDAITHQALHDSLTGLANRRQFTGQLRTAVHNARGLRQLVTLFFVDLDGFKPVNDELGHEIGDELLAAVGQRLATCTRTADSVARLGGDEFAVLIGPHLSPADADVVAGRLAQTFNEPFEISGQRLTLGASIGRAMFPTNGDGADDLLRAADTAMFDAKRAAYSCSTSHSGRRGPGLVFRAALA